MTSPDVDHAPAPDGVSLGAAPSVRFAHHGITVGDLDSSVAFFRDVLGLQPQPQVDLDEEFSAGVTGVEGARISVVFMTAPGVDVELLRYHAPVGRRRVTTRPCDTGSAHLALYVDDVDDVVRQARPHGWTLRGVVQPIAVGPRAGGRAAYLQDLDGAVLELVQRP